MRKNIGWLWVIFSLAASAFCTIYAYRKREELDVQKLHSLLLISACTFASFFHGISYLKRLNQNE